MKWSSERSAELEREVASWDWQEPEKVLERIRLLLNSAESPEEKLGLLTSEATCHQLMGRSDLAERALQMARFSGPNGPGSHLLVAYGQMRLLEDGDKWVESLALLDKMISGHDFKSISALPEWQHLVTHIFFSRGLALFSLGRFQEAEIPLREALKGSLDKEKRGPANYILGYILFENGNTQGARGFLTEASRFPMKRAYSVQSHYLLGLALARLGDCNGAKAEFIAAETEGDGSEVPKKNVYQMLSNVSQSLGEANEARRYEGLAKGVRQ